MSKLRYNKVTVGRVQEELYSVIPAQIPDTIVCIGSPEYSYDSLAPAIGSILSHKNLTCKVYGTTTEPIDSINSDFLSANLSNLSTKTVLAIDSAEGGLFDQLGSVIISKGSIQPGEALGKELSSIGNYSIKIVTCKKIFNKRIYLDESKQSKLCLIISKALSNYYRR